MLDCEKQEMENNDPGVKTGQGFSRLLHEVIEPGLCTICGTCAGVCPTAGITMRVSDYERDEPAPVLEKDCSSCSWCYDSCPGKSVPLADLDRFVFGRERDPLGEPLGIYRQCLRGYAREPVRTTSTSGGIARAVVMYALDKGYIDAAIMAVRSKEHPWRAVPGIVTSSREASFAIRGVMEAVPVNSLLSEAIIEAGLRVGVVGLPCQVHGIRKIQMKKTPDRIAEGIVFTVGLFCNSAAYYTGIEHLLKECGGIDSLADIAGIDYRAGDWPGAMMAVTKDGKIRNVASREFAIDFLSKANYRRDRCLMCIDFSAELADISLGNVFKKVDANSRWSTVITRTEIGDGLVAGAVRDGYISHIEDHDPKLVPAGGTGWEMSKHASMYRWMERKKHGWPVPEFQYPPGIEIVQR